MEEMEKAIEEKNFETFAELSMKVSNYLVLFSWWTQGNFYLGISVNTKERRVVE